MEQPRKVIKIADLDATTLLGTEVEADISPDLPRRQWLYAWLLNPNIPGNHQKSVDKWIAILIVLNLFAMVLEHVPAIFEPYKNWFHAFDAFSVGVFVIEYLTRFYLAPEDEEFKAKGNPRLSYMASPFAIIDLLAILPYLLQAFVPVDLRALRFLRLLRISAIVDGCFSLIVHGETASARKRWEGAQAPGWNVAQSSTISLKRAV